MKYFHRVTIWVSAIKLPFFRFMGGSGSRNKSESGAQRRSPLHNIFSWLCSIPRETKHLWSNVDTSFASLFLAESQKTKLLCGFVLAGEEALCYCTQRRNKNSKNSHFSPPFSFNFCCGKRFEQLSNKLWCKRKYLCFFSGNTSFFFN